jgi:hypothetical protein
MVTGISISAMLDEINSGNAFDIEYVTADERRKKGGELKRYSGCIKSQSVTSGKADKKYEPVVNVTNQSKNPHHEAHVTFNIYVPHPDEGSKIKKVHTRLVTQFNGKDVL